MKCFAFSRSTFGLAVFGALSDDVSDVVEFLLDVTDGDIDFTDAGDTMTLVVDAPPEYAGTYADIDITPLAGGVPVNWALPSFAMDPQAGLPVDLIDSQWFHPAAGVVQITHQVQANTGPGDAWEDVSGATGATYTPDAALAGRLVRIAATGAGVTVYSVGVTVLAALISVVPAITLAPVADLPSYTETGVNIGTPDATRRVFVAWAGYGGDAITVTIGGVTATQEVLHGWGVHRMAIYSALVPTGTSATVTMTHNSGSFNKPVFMIWTTTGATVASVGGIGGPNISAGPASATVTAVEGGTVITAVMAAASAWTFNAGDPLQQQGASDGLLLVASNIIENTTAGSLTVTATATSGTDRYGYAVIVLEPV